MTISTARPVNGYYPLTVSVEETDYPDDHNVKKAKVSTKRYTMTYSPKLQKYIKQ